MHYVYILRSLVQSERTYTGITDHLTTRLENHNSGAVPYTSKFRPWIVETFVAFTSLEKARKFECYLKSGSGRAFSKKHFG